MLKLYRYLKPFRHLVYGVFILIFLQTLGDLYLPTLMSDIINDGVMNGDTQKILHIGGVMLLVAGAAAVFSILASFLSAKAAVGLGTVLRSKLFGRIESFSLHEFDKIGTATLITRTTNDINQVQTVTIMIMRMMISAPIMAIGGIILAYREDKALTWVFAVAIPVLAIVIVMIASKMIPLFRLVQGKIDRINLVLREKLTGVRVIRAFNTIEHEKSVLMPPTSISQTTTLK